jgi:5-methylcytosine-specific restriction endonuclease McrA
VTVIKICPSCEQPHEGDHDCPNRTARRKVLNAADRIRSSARWKRARARRLRTDGARCTYGTFAGESFWMADGRCPVVVKLDVHHRTPIEQGGAPFDQENLRTLCHQHHRRIENAR